MRFGRSLLACSSLLGTSLLLGCAGVTGQGIANDGIDGDKNTGRPSNQILYVLNNAAISTYSIDPVSLNSTLAGHAVELLPSSASLVQFDPSPDARFVYLLWDDGNARRHLSVFANDAAGVPQIPAVQMVNADSLSQFNMHPSGRFAYMLGLTESNGVYEATIRLFNVQAGELRENGQVQGQYGPALSIPAFLYGFSADGKELYDTSLSGQGSVYRRRSINVKTGLLGSDQTFFAVSNYQDVIISNVVVSQYHDDMNSSHSYVNVFASTSDPGAPAIHCTLAMLTFCASARDVRLDRSGHYLFFTDAPSQAVHIGRIDLSNRTIMDTGSFFPMTSQVPGFAFSPDGSIVYAMLAADSSVHFYHFYAKSGNILEGGIPLPLASGAGINPAQRQ